MYSAKNENNSGRFFRTSLKELDDVLQGGLPTGCITEVNIESMFTLVHETLQ